LGSYCANPLEVQDTFFDSRIVFEDRLGSGQPQSRWLEQRWFQLCFWRGFTIDLPLRKTLVCRDMPWHVLRSEDQFKLSFQPILTLRLP
jgi:hypothetical protein